MRVCLVVEQFPVPSETFIVAHFLGLLERGWDAHLVCHASDASGWASYPGLRERAEVRERVHVTGSRRPLATLARESPGSLARRLRHDPRATRRWLRAAVARPGRYALRRWHAEAPLLDLRPQVVHFEFGADAVGHMHLGRVLDAALVVSFRGWDLNLLGLDTPDFYAEVWRDADAVHCLGEDLWARALRRGCPPGKPHALIPPAVDTRGFVPDERPPEAVGTAARPLRVLGVGRLVAKKGYPDALAAVQALLERGIEVEYRIAGSGPQRDAIASRAERLGLTGNVRLLGMLDRWRLRDELQRADVLLHAAVSEGFCNAVLEAQAMQLPVVCTDADGLAENVEHGVTGFVVARGDSVAMAERLALLTGSAQLRRQMGSAGRQRVRERFRPDQQLDAFAALYRTAAASRDGEPVATLGLPCEGHVAKRRRVSLPNQ